MQENNNVEIEALVIESELEPTVLAKVSEVTGAEPNPGDGDVVDNIVWGNEP